MRCSGHESFACRYSWIPKALESLREGPKTLEDEDEAMVRLGVGKNMVRSIRFWIQVFGTAESCKQGLVPTRFGGAVFGERGLDPYLEDPKTLWLLHWNVSSIRDDALFAWDFILSRWPKAEFTRSEVAAAAARSLRGADKAISKVTLDQHLDIFIRTYCASAPDDTALEDELDSPLAQIRLVERVATRVADKANEDLYALRIDEKPEVSPQMFVYCVDDFWQRHRPNEKTLSFRDVAFAPGGPGTVFRLTEQSVRSRLESIESDSNGHFDYNESSGVPSIARTRVRSPQLKDVYAST